MAGTPRQKQKALLLLRILWERTDEQHPLTLTELGEELARAGIKWERKSLYRDLKAISEAGFPVESVRSKDTRYYWADRPLSQRDVVLLSNLLRNFPVISRKRKLELEKKLCRLIPISCQRTAFTELFSVIPDGSVTERIFSMVEILFDSISAGKKVRFFYKGSVLSEHSSRRKSSRYQTVSPYRLLWIDGYYLIAADEEGDLTFYRVDRMEELTVTSLAATDIREVGGDLEFDLNQYIKGYFTSLQDPIHMIFRVNERFLSGAERYFPSDSVIESTADGSYLLTCDIPADDSLFGWLLLHSDDVRLCYPESLVSRLQDISFGVSKVYAAVDTAESGINYEERGNTVDKSKEISYN